MTQPLPRSAGEEERDPLAALSVYELRHLAEHLAAAGRSEELHRLLSLEWTEPLTAGPLTVTQRRSRLSRLLRRHPPPAVTIIAHNAWYAAKERLGDIDGFVNDLDSADGLAAAVAEGALKKDAASDGKTAQDSKPDNKIAPDSKTTRESTAASGIGLEILYAVARSSVNSMASGLPPQLLGELATRGGWSFEQARAYARRAASPQRRAESLAALIPAAPAGEGERLGWESLALLSEINEDSGVYSSNPGELSRRKVLEQLAPLLSRAQLREALNQVDAFRDGSERVSAEAALLPPLARCGDVELALERCLGLKNVSIRERSLDQFADLLNEAQLDSALAGVADAEEKLRFGLVAVVAPRLAAFGRAAEALRQTEEMAKLSYPGPMMQALRSFPPGIDTDVVEKALHIARAIEQPENRASALTGMFARSAAGRDDVLSEALTAIAADPWDYRQAQQLAELAPLLTDSQVATAAAVAIHVRGAADRVKALAALGHGRPPEVRAKLRGLLGATRGLKDDRAMVGLAVLEPERVLQAIERDQPGHGIVAEVVGDLPAALLPRALAVTRAIRDERAQSNALARIAAQRRLRNVHSLDDLDGVTDERLRGEMLGRIASFLPGDGRNDGADGDGRHTGDGGEVGKALKLAIGLTDSDARAAALTPLVPRLSVAQLDLALGAFGESFCRTEPPGWRWLGGLILPRLPEQLLDKALATANRQRRDAWVGWALATLIPYLDGARLQRAIASARKLGNDGDYQRSAALAAAAGRFARLGDLDRAMGLAGDIAEPRFEADAIVGIAEASPPERCRELLSLAYRLSGDQEHRRGTPDYRVRALLALALHGPGDQRQARIAEALEITDLASKSERGDALTAAAKMLPADRLGLVLDRLAAIGWEGTRLTPLVAAAPRLQGALLERGLVCARGFTDPEFAFQALLAFVPSVQGPARAELLWQAIDVAGRETFDIRRQELFASLATALGELNPVPAHRAWRAVLAAVARRERAAVLDTVGSLAPLVADIAGTTALDEAEAGIRDAVRWWP